MPNWCQNQLTVTGATPELRAWLKTEGFSFGKMNPLPGGESADLEIRYATWGTKWDLDEIRRREVADDLLRGSPGFFDTAWAPPFRAIEALSRRFAADTLTLRYCELGMFFAGRATFRGGAWHETTVGDEASVMRIAREVFGHGDGE
jgi:hypothetical protein